MQSKSLASFILFLLVYLLHANSHLIQSIDSTWTIHTAQSVLSEGDLDLDEYRAQVKARNHYGIRKRHGHIYNYFPYGTALLSVPFVWFFNQAPETLAYLVPGARERCGELRESEIPCTATTARLPLERAIASLFVALCAVVLFLTLIFVAPMPAALLAALAFAFGTSAWSTASRGLWQHGPSMLMLTSAFYCVLRGERERRFLAWSALPLAYAYVIRPTNGALALAFFLFILLRHRAALPRFLLIFALAIAPFILFNFATFHHAFPSYYRASRLEFSRDFFEALAANLVSPSRGVLLLSPFLLFAIRGVPEFLRQHPAAKLALACVILQLVTVALFPHWWGGHCFGSRLMSDVTPFLIFLSIPLFVQIASRPAWFRALFALALVLSAAIHFRGANSQATFHWNAHPVDIDTAPERVWSLRDMQAVR